MDKGLFLITFITHFVIGTVTQNINVTTVSTVITTTTVLKASNAASSSTTKTPSTTPPITTKPTTGPTTQTKSTIKPPLKPTTKTTTATLKPTVTPQKTMSQATVLPGISSTKTSVGVINNKTSNVSPPASTTPTSQPKAILPPSRSAGLNLIGSHGIQTSAPPGSGNTTSTGGSNNPGTPAPTTKMNSESNASVTEISLVCLVFSYILAVV